MEKVVMGKYKYKSFHIMAIPEDGHSAAEFYRCEGLIDPRPGHVQEKLMVGHIFRKVSQDSYKWHVIRDDRTVWTVDPDHMDLARLDVYVR